MHAIHNCQPGECRAATAPYWASRGRRGRHPRPGHRRASGDPTVGLPGTHDGAELGGDDEEAAKSPAAGAASSSAATAHPTAETPLEDPPTTGEVRTDDTPDSARADIERR